MKGIMIVLFLCLESVCQAQTFDEWFRQNKTRLKYYEQQIVALQTYIATAEKGYKIVESGLSTIRDIKSGEFNLHNGFYTGLEQVNPVIGKMDEVAEILALQAAIVVRFSVALTRYRQNGGLRPDEVDYISKVYRLVLSEGLADINELLDLTTAGKLKMSDDQRLERVRELDVGMKERYALTKELTDQADLLCLQRQVQQSEIGSVKGLYGLP